MNAIINLLATAGCRDLDDASLLARFATERDAAAFEVLVWRHGGVVRGVCRRYLRDPNDIDDVSQATFLALARKARSVRSVGPWLTRVAAHAARRLHRANAARAARLTATAADVPAREPSLDDGWRGILAEEIARLPDRYRVIVRRCYLDGLTASEAARELGWARGTVLTRLAWAKARLRHRLTSRGVILGAGGVAGLLFQLAAGPVTRAAARDILRALAGAPVWRAAWLTDGVLTAMFWTKVKFAAGIVLVCSVALVAAAVSQSGSPADGPVKTKPGAGPGFGSGANALAAPVASDSSAESKAEADSWFGWFGFGDRKPAADGPIKTKPGVGPGFGSGAGGATPLVPAGPVKTKTGAGPGSGSGSGGGATPIRP